MRSLLLLLLLPPRPHHLATLYWLQVKRNIITADLVAHEAVEDEDKKSLQAVENREHVSHEQWLGVDVEQTKQPRETQQYH